MRQRRQLAPWHRKDLAVSSLCLNDAAVAKALAALEGKAAIYHCLSRVVNRDRIFRRAEREEFVRVMRKYAAFCQVHVLTYCVMSNHFHILVEVPSPPDDGGTSWSDKRLLGHLDLIYGASKVAELRSELKRLRDLNDQKAVDAFRARYFRRMWDLSEYMKAVKQCFTQWFNRRHGRRGVLWEERFKSELVEEGHAARRVAAYIDLNPVRAGLVHDPKDWRWSGYGEAVAGRNVARLGLMRILFEEATTRMNGARAAKEIAGWKQVLEGYRRALFFDGESRSRDRHKGRRGISRERVKRVLKEGGRLSEAQLLLCRTRYFIDGFAIGSESYIEHVNALARARFGTKRTSGARRLRGVNSELCILRDLRGDPLGC